MSEKRIHLIEQIDYALVNQGNADERNEISSLTLGYFEGTEEEAENLCRRLEVEVPNKYKVEGDNEYFTYPMIRHHEIPKLF